MRCIGTVRAGQSARHARRCSDALPGAGEGWSREKGRGQNCRRNYDAFSKSAHAGPIGLALLARYGAAGSGWHIGAGLGRSDYQAEEANKQEAQTMKRSKPKVDLWGELFPMLSKNELAEFAQRIKENDSAKQKAKRGKRHLGSRKPEQKAKEINA